MQIKQAKLARELEASVSGERALLERVNELEQEVRDVSSTSRSRIRWLEASSDQAKRRVEQLFRELVGAAPLKVRARVPVRRQAMQPIRYSPPPPRTCQELS